MFNNNDLEIMLLTYNRKELLKESLGSVLNQSVTVKTTVFDNASTDGTEAYVNQLMTKYPQLHYFKQEKNVGGGGNFKSAIEQIKSKYVIFFHDDDFLHPQYVEFVLKTLNKYENVDLICSNMTYFSKNNEVNLKTLSKCNVKIFRNKPDFAIYVYTSPIKKSIPLYYPNVVYRAKNLKKVTTDNYIKYGKIGDKPFVIDLIQNGICVQMEEPQLTFYRIHPGQDSSTSANGPYPNEIINFNKYFMNIFQKNPKYRIICEISSFYWLKFLWRWGHNKDNLTLFNLVKIAYKENVVGIYSLISAFILTKPFMEILTKLLIKNFNVPYEKDIL